MSIAEELQKELENYFQMPFSVSKVFEASYPTWRVTPRYDRRIYGLFTLDIELSGKHRVDFLVKPERLSRDMMLAITSNSKESREFSESFFRALDYLGTTISLIINGETYQSTDCSTWPSQWDSFSITTSRGSIHSREDWPRISDYLDDLCNVLSAVFVLFSESSNLTAPIEGTALTQKSKRYERNPIYRKLCINKYGYTCQVCGFNFEDVYGYLGKDFIEVHHIQPVSEYAEPKVLDPEKDLIPVCSNCHAMLHRGKTVLLPEELRKILKESPK